MKDRIWRRFRDQQARPRPAQGGIGWFSLPQAVREAFGAFLRHPLALLTGAADRVGELLRPLGVGIASPERKQELGRQVDGEALLFAGAILRGLGRSPEAARATGVDRGQLATDLGKLDQLQTARTGAGMVEDHAVSVQRVLIGWQAEAQRRILDRILAELSDPAIDVSYKLKLIVDAVEVLDDAQDQARKRSKARRDAARAREQTKAKVESYQKWAKLKETIQAVRDRQPVPQEQLLEMAEFLRELLSEKDGAE